MHKFRLLIYSIALCISTYSPQSSLAQTNSSFLQTDISPINADNASQVEQIGALSMGDVRGIFWRNPTTLAIATMTGIREYDVHNLNDEPQIKLGDVPIERISQDGSTAVSSRLGDLSFWDTPTGSLINNVDMDACTWQLSPMGTRLAYHCHGTPASLLDVKTGQVISRSSDYGAVWGTDIGFTPDEGAVFVDIYSGITVLGCEACDTTLVETEGVTSVRAVSPDNQFLATGQRQYPDQESNIQLWDLQTGTKIFEFVQNFENDVVGIIFSPDSAILAALSTQDGDKTAILRLWQVEDMLDGSAEYLGIIGVEGMRYRREFASQVRMSFSLDGSRLMVGGLSDGLRIWDFDHLVSGGSDRLYIPRKPSLHNHTIFSPNGQYLAYTEDDYSVHLWDIGGKLEEWHEIGVLEGFVGSAHKVAISPDNRMLARIDDCRVEVWNLESGARLPLPDVPCVHRFTEVRFSRDGKQLFLGLTDDGIHIVDLNSWVIIEKVTDFPGDIDIITFTGRSETWALARFSDMVRSFNLTTDLAVGNYTFSDSPYPVQLSPNGNYVAGHGYDQPIQIFDAESEEISFTIDYPRNPSLFALAFSHNEKQFAVGGAGEDDESLGLYRGGQTDEGLLELWALMGEGELLHTFAGHTEMVVDVAFNRDDTLLASASEDDTIHLWDTTTGEQLAVLEGHTSDVRRVIFSDDGRLLISVGLDNIRFWGVPN